jgi:hypothetical protein
MKILLLRVLFLAAAAGGAVLSVSAQNYPVPSFTYATSPDHPSTWVDGATRTHQDLRWSDDKHMLVADVTYSTRDYADNTHPTEDDSYTLRFPTVHFDSATGKFTVGGVTVAHLEHGFFGSHVALEPKVALSIHRHHGVITAALIPGTSD